MNKVFSFRRHFSLSKSYRWHSLLLIGAILSTLLVSSAFGQADYQNLAVVVNALTHLDLGITTSLSLIDLDEPNAKRAVADEILPLGNVPSDLLIHGHLAYIPNVYSDNILIINLERREIVGEIPIREGAQPQQLALINDDKMYVTCDAAHEVHVIDLPNRKVTKTIVGGFNKPSGITVLKGKAYVTNPAWEYDPAEGKVHYYDSSVMVIDTETDVILKSIPMPTNATGILNDGDSTVIVKTTGDYNLIPGNIVLINAATDEVSKTVKLQLTPGSFALNSEKQLFIQGGWLNPGLLIYDVIAQDWIRDKGNMLANFSNDEDAPISGSLTFGPDGNLYITMPDWSGSGQDYVRVMDVVDESLLQTYYIGPGGSILAFARIVPRREDVNDNGFVNLEDLIIVARFLDSQGPGIIADVNGDEVVNILDLVLIGQGL